MIFTNIDARPRTNESFRAKADIRHHKGDTPLTDLPIDMILDFPVGDELHLLHLGLIKKFLIAWKSGAFGMRTKWSTRNVEEISEYLVSCNEYRPSEIHRKIRALSELPRWKGTELRTFLLYNSLTVLKKFLPAKHFKHYLLFYCSIVILGSEYHCKIMIHLADDMIRSFLNIFKSIYGIEHFTSNLHNLIHLVDEVRKFGVLGKFNAYSFENKLQTIKKLVRSGNMPLTQIAKRILEQKYPDNENNFPEDLSTTVLVKKLVKYNCKDFQELGTDYTVFEELKTNDFRIASTKGNHWVFTRNHDIIRIKYFVNYPSKGCFFYGEAIAEKTSYFDTPFDSNALFIYAAKNELERKKLYPIGEIVCKMFCLPYCGSFDDSEMEEEFPPLDYVFVPLWHTLK